jgi:hypothetical protein
MAAGKRIVWGVATVLFLAATFVAGFVVATLGLGPAVSTSTLPERERQFSERMTSVSLVGQFTLGGQGDRPAAEDRYDIENVEKLGDGRWRFNVRMRHGSVDVTLPVSVPLQWLGDTPVIVMRDYAIPTLGTFSALVAFDGDRYAGTWQNGDFGGHMFGRIEPQQ